MAVDNPLTLASTASRPDTTGDQRFVGTFRYVRIDDVWAYAAIGWQRTYILDKTPHGQWSAVMEWKGEGEERIPERSMDGERQQ